MSATGDSSCDERCPFCTAPTQLIVDENELAFAIRDRFPVAEGHTLVTPRRHVAGFFDVNDPELVACRDLLVRLRRGLQLSDPLITGFNVGANIGSDAGQTIFHCLTTSLGSRAPL